MAVEIAAIVIKVLRIIWKIIKYIITILLYILMIVSNPFIYLIAENRYVKFKNYKGKPKEYLIIKWAKNTNYIAWGLLGVSVVFFSWFAYKSFSFFVHDFFCFEQGSFYKGVVIFFTIVVTLIYYTILQTLTRGMKQKNEFGDVGIQVFLIKYLFVFFVIAFLSLPEYMMEEDFYLENLIEQNFVGILNINQLKLNKYYRLIVLKNTILFSLCFILKIILVYVDRKYLALRKNEIKLVF